jgi:hypothetical protein
MAARVLVRALALGVGPEARLIESQLAPEWLSRSLMSASGSLGIVGSSGGSGGGAAGCGRSGENACAAAIACGASSPPPLLRHAAASSAHSVGSPRQFASPVGAAPAAAGS